MLDFIILVEVCLKKSGYLYIYQQSALRRGNPKYEALGYCCDWKISRIKVKNMQSIRVNNFSCRDL